jgi:hypothetical protein
MNLGIKTAIKESLGTPQNVTGKKLNKWDGKIK